MTLAGTVHHVYPPNHLSCEFRESINESRVISPKAPWVPTGLEAIWSKGHQASPTFMQVRQSEYEMSIAETGARVPSDLPPWEPSGLEAIWSNGHRASPEFMDTRRSEYEYVQDNLRTMPEIKRGDYESC